MGAEEMDTEIGDEGEMPAEDPADEEMPDEEMPDEEMAGEESELIVDPDEAPMVIKFLENLLGLLKDEAGEDSEEMDMDMDMAPDPDMDMDMDPEEMAVDEEEEEEEEMPALQMESMVNKIAARVAKRILSRK